MNRYAWCIAAAYVGLAVVSAGVFLLTTAKWVDYSETQLRFSTTTSAYVASANVTSPTSGSRSIDVLWRFENSGRLPITIAIFQFRLYVDNGSDSRPWYDGEKLAQEYRTPLSFNLDRFTGLVVPPSGTADWRWQVNVTAPGDVARILPHSEDGKYHLVFFDTRIVYYISDVDNRQTLDLSAFVLAVGA